MRLISQLVLAATLAFVSPAAARNVTDHGGNVVEVPDAPQRILSLHDWTLTVMTRELDAPLIASAGRLAPDGTTFIRGGRELFGLNFDQIALAAIHGKPDLERIRSLKPDLIVANIGDYSALREQLSTIAPTLMFDAENGDKPFDLYRQYAGWIGRQARFDALKAAYDKRITEARQKLPKTLIDGSYSAILANERDGTLTMLKEYGVQTTVLDDLGMSRTALAQSVPEGQSRMTIGAELIGEIDADLIVTSYLPESGESPESIFPALTRIAPGYEAFLRAHEAKRILSFSRYEIYPPSFRGADIFLDRLEVLID
ncbi:iron complex transport system substrate-binding protein [Neorhizobium huautlense]|uniref:Iron complex transport system substrate-binding protein n=1 Tax=Neorhizobium huautlense TaxID=67774 RepID=A0ABT9PMQ4_9HYPH|nr:ABC transporter substrate-binding protein [Neorhizobium huautlense]MDP9835491.1 iron complex transport system substrate-binding protein [Neorhizobium huautlense]